VDLSRLAEIARVLNCGVMDVVGDLDTLNTSAVFKRQVARLNELGAAELLEAIPQTERPSSNAPLSALLNNSRKKSRRN
jgi:hypothetical protein